VGAVTYVVNAVNEGVVAAVAHCQPVAAEPDDVDVAVPAGAQGVADEFSPRHVTRYPFAVQSP
jgi:hypothetical protein